MSNNEKSSPSAENLNEFWMPFTSNQRFKSEPKILTKSKGMFYESDKGQKILDGTSGLWCCNAGHGREKIIEAVKNQIEKMEFAPTFQVGHPNAYLLAERLGEISP
ncbi:MAG: aminotransferase class III-fold pyridoxal phosphate-dependent enzyme, partial [Gammaproteobacteria bacterium]|nr:aminotransferase class III-fold pyridoxal phosphate-dependent enzyme [Gammaproteobacteria bacterium]